MDLRWLSLRSERLRLRAYTEADAEEVFAAVTPNVARFMAWEPEPSIAAHHALFARLVASMAEGREFAAAIRLARTGEFIGMAGLHRLRSDPPELGVWLKEAAHGAGFGREAVARLTRWASDLLRVKAFAYPVAGPNMASRRLAEALGGQIVGRSRFTKPSGASYELVVYRIPAPEPTPAA